MNIDAINLSTLLEDAFSSVYSVFSSLYSVTISVKKPPVTNTNYAFGATPTETVVADTAVKVPEGAFEPAILAPLRVMQGDSVIMIKSDSSLMNVDWSSIKEFEILDEWAGGAKHSAKYEVASIIPVGNSSQPIGLLIHARRLA